MQIDLLIKNLMKNFPFSQRSLNNLLFKNHKQNNTAGFQPRTQSISVTLNPNKKNTVTTELISPTAVTGISNSTNFVVILGVTIPMQAPTKTIRSNPVNLNEANTSEKFISQDNSPGVTSRQSHFQTLQVYRFFNLREPKRI